jgi:VanZ family protein
MSTSPALLRPAACEFDRPMPVRRPALSARWLYALLAIGFIACTSTSLTSGMHSQVIVNDLWRAAFGQWHFAATSELNVLLRKVSHFIGYGMIGLIFRNAWQGSLRLGVGRRWIDARLFAASSALSILSIFLLASLDEWHQTIVPGRVGCFGDVMIDTAGAIFINAVFWAAVARNRHNGAESALNAEGSAVC